MKKSLLFLFIIGGICLGQEHIYRDALQNALADSAISSDESSMLETLRISLDLSQDQVLTIKQNLIRNDNITRERILNQEGRWWIIYQNMILGNGLYGTALPYVLGIEDENVLGGLQLLLFAGGYYATSSYTKKMDIPFGRAIFQNTGGGLGMFGAYTLIPIIGFENWYDFDPDAKLFLTIEMIAAPLGIWQADKIYRNWNPSDGQAALITGSTGLGAFNTWGLYTFLTDIPEEFDDIENWLRLGIPLTYGGALASAYYTNRYVQSRNYTRGDANFVSSGVGLGLFYWLELSALLEPDTYRGNILLGLATINGAVFLSDYLVQSVDMTQGDASIIGLGSGASWLAWQGFALLTSMDTEDDIFRLVDLAAVSAGWYFTFKTVSKKRFVQRDNDNYQWTFSLNPSFIHHPKTGVLPALGFQIQF